MNYETPFTESCCSMESTFLWWNPMLLEHFQICRKVGGLVTWIMATLTSSLGVADQMGKIQTVVSIATHVAGICTYLNGVGSLHREMAPMPLGKSRDRKRVWACIAFHSPPPPNSKAVHFFIFKIHVLESVLRRKHTSACDSFLIFQVILNMISRGWQAEKGCSLQSEISICNYEHALPCSYLLPSMLYSCISEWQGLPATLLPQLQLCTVQSDHWKKQVFKMEFKNICLDCFG